MINSLEPLNDLEYSIEKEAGWQLFLWEGLNRGFTG
jgi:hypothetical protein